MSYYTSKELNDMREKMPCKFDEGITYHEFEQIAKNVAKQFQRIKEVTVGNGKIFCEVESLTGRSEWYFSVDFNNWGHIEGTYWWYTDNKDSNMCKAYGEQVQKEINQFSRNKNIILPDYEDLIETNKNSLPRSFSYIEEETFWEKTFARRKQITFDFNPNMFNGEHICGVFLMLKRMGFKNIKSYRRKDIGSDSNHYIYEVDCISIKGASHLQKGDVFPSNAAITIYYHDKKEIALPYSSKYYKRKNYITVGDEFVDMGFSKIYERKIEDLLTGWIIKDGSVEEVFVKKNNKEILMEKGKRYEFDTPIIITYHTYKRL